MKKEDQETKPNLNRWKLLQNIYYRGSKLDFLQLVFNLKKKVPVLYCRLEYFSEQAEMQGIKVRRIQQIITELYNDGVLIVAPYEYDRRKNTYDLDWAVIEHRAANPKPSRKPPKVKKEFIGTEAFECGHEGPFLRTHFCQHCLSSMFRKLMKRGIDIFELLKEEGIGAESASIYEGMDAESASNFTSDVVDKTRDESTCSDHGMDAQSASNAEKAEWTHNSASNRRSKVRLITQESASIPRKKVRLLFEENSPQTADIQEVIVTSPKPTEVLLKLSEASTSSSCLRHNEGCNGIDTTTKAKPEPISLNSSDVTFPATAIPTATLSVEIDSSLIDSRPLSQDAPQSSALAAGEAKGSSMRDNPKGTVRTGMSAEDRERKEQYERLLQSDPRAAEIHNRMKAILNKSKQAASA